jgi:hypothetical protein
LRFIAMLLPMLDAEALARASDVRLKPGDPARAMLAPAAPGALPIRGTCR